MAPPAGKPTDPQPSPERPSVFVVYDFVCPYSYIAQHEVDRLEAEFEIETPSWRPYWLHPDVPEAGRSFPPAVDDAKIESVLEWLEQMSPELGHNVRFPERQQYSLHAFAAMEFARDQSAATAFLKAVFRALWTESRDIGDPSTINDLLTETGLDPDEYRSTGHDGTFRRRALAASKKTQTLGLTTTPTVLLGRTAITGWHYYEVLEQTLEDQHVPRRAT
jgi:predicted DsbA family dithiol-disulfide isomerase